MSRTLLWSPLWLALLSPAGLPPISCNHMGNPSLSLLEVEAAGLDRIVDFSSATTTYDAWTPEGVETITLRATTVVPSARVAFRLTGPTWVTGNLGTGGGETTLTIPVGTPASLLLEVTDGGAIRRYAVNLNAACSAGECDDADPCTVDTCNASVCEFNALPDGTMCTAGPVTEGRCFAGDCVVPNVCGNGVIEPGEECDDGNTLGGDTCSTVCEVPTSTKEIPLACDDDFAPIPPIFSVVHTLTLDPQGPIVAGEPFDVLASGFVEFPEEILDMVQSVVSGGETKMEVIEFNATVSARSGATGPGIVLSTLPLNFDLPISSNPAICASFGKSDQFNWNGFCIVASLRLALAPVIGTFTAAESGEVLFGWDESLSVPTTVAFEDPAGANGVRAMWAEGTVPYAAECTMAFDSGDPLPDDFLISLPIVDPVCLTGDCSLPDPCGNGVVDPGEECDDGENDGGGNECLDCLGIQLCGDGITEGTEECDDGQNDGNGSLGCLAGCLSP